MNLPHIEPRNMAIAMRDDETRRAIEARFAGPARHLTIVGDAVPARAGHASHRTLLRGFGHTVTIAIAVFAAAWFLAHLISAAGQL